MTFHEWLQGFLQRRALERPDGRPLFRYEISDAEYSELEALLRSRADSERFAGAQVRCLVLYGACWFSRSYEGGPPEWDGLLRSIGWEQWAYFQYYEDFRAAFAHWGVELFRTNQGRQYVGSMLRQAGIPRKLQRGRLRTFLVGCMADFPPLRWGHRSGAELLWSRRAQLPLYLQNYELLSLCGQLLDVVWDADQRGMKPPPEAMPVSMTEEEARGLVEALRSVAPKTVEIEGYKRPVGFIRRLVHRGNGEYELRGEFQFAKRVAKEGLRAWAGTELPMRVDLRAPSLGGRLIAVARENGASFAISPARPSARIVLSEAATRPILAEARAPGAVSREIQGGEGLSDLPWVFALTGEGGEFAGEGSVTLSSTGALVVVPAGSASVSASAEHVGRLLGLGRDVYRLSSHAVVLIDGAECQIALSSERSARKTVRLRGEELSIRGAEHRLFAAAPKVEVCSDDDPSVRVLDLEWKNPATGEWARRVPGFGGYRVRALDAGELIFAGELGIVPRAFRISLYQSTHGTKGYVVSGAKHARLGGWCKGGIEGLAPEITRHGDQCVIQFHPDRALGSSVEIASTWDVGGALRFTLPSPIERVSFEESSGNALRQLEVGVDELYGLSAVAYSAAPGVRFSLLASLKAADMSGQMLQSATLSVELRPAGRGAWALELDEIYDRVAELLSFSNDVDASVRLELLQNATTLKWIAVSRFSRRIAVESLMTDGDLSEVRVSSSGRTSIAAISLRRPETGLVPILEAGLSATLPTAGSGVEVTGEGAPWLLVGQRVSAQAVRPAIWAPPAEIDTASELRAAVASGGNAAGRIERMVAALAALLADWDEDSADYLVSLLEAGAHVHPAALDIYSALQEMPEILPHLLLRSSSEQMTASVLALGEDFPFSMHLVPQRAWGRAIAERVERLRNRVEGMANEYEDQQVLYRTFGRALLSFYADLAAVFPAIERFAPALPLAIRSEVARETQGFEQVDPEFVVHHLQGAYRSLLLRMATAQWPHSHMDIDFWRRALESTSTSASSHLSQAFGLVFPGLERDRVPLVAAPLGVAFVSAVAARPSAAMQLTAKRMRSMDTPWFDTAYSCGLALAQVTGDMEV